MERKLFALLVLIHLAGADFTAAAENRLIGSRLAVANLELHVDEINALNVFPVPDGDTGTNMAATVRAALDEVELVGRDAPAERIAVEDRVVAEADQIIAECPRDEEDLISLYDAAPARITFPQSSIKPSTRITRAPYA